MSLLVSDITDEEYALISPKFQEKADALMKSQNKKWAVVNLPKPNFKKIVINGKRYIAAGKNIFMGVMEGTLQEAAQKFPENFGIRNANKVLDALYKIRPVGHRDHFDELISTEQFALVFEVDDEDNISDQVLRLDLFRMIKQEKKDNSKYEFIGGLFHVLKHFISKGLPLSTNKEKEEIKHPNEIIQLIIETFFQSQHVPNDKGFDTELTINGKNYCMGFFKEKVAGISFLNTFHRK